ncbi:MAG: IPT/TIG domain-containing protein, partial [Thiohalomonadales bacterium]
GVGNQFEVLLTGTGFVPASVVLFGNVLATNVRYINDQELRATIPALAAGSYNVTVDGHQTGAPNFSVITQATITPDYWPIGGRSVEMIYDANNHALYSLDIVGKLLTRINLTDNTSINQSIANASDLSWCPADGFLYVATGVDFRQYNAATLQFIQVMATTTVDRLECVSENNIVLTAENQFQYYKLFNSDTSTVISSQTFASGRLYSPTVDGVSSIGDRILFGESGITTPDRVLFTPHLLSASNLADAGTYLTSSWSDDGSIGVINNSTVVNNSLSTLGTLTAPVVASVVSSDGSKIFVMPDNTTVQKIILDPANPSAFAVSATYSIPLTSDIGTVYRIEISLDGNTIFVSGGSGIVAIDVIN